MAKENEALYDFRLGIKNFKGYQEICYTLKKKYNFYSVQGCHSQGKAQKKKIFMVG